MSQTKDNTQRVYVKQYYNQREFKQCFAYNTIILHTTIHGNKEKLWIPDKIL